MSLFDLETSLASRTARHPRTRKGEPGLGGNARAMAFDHGEPVRLDVGGDLQRLARVSPRALHGGRPADWVRSASVAMLSGDVGGSWVVESFEEPGEGEQAGMMRTSAMCLADRVDAPSRHGSGNAGVQFDTIEVQPPTTTVSSRAAESEYMSETPATDGGGREAPMARARARHAEHVSAFERDLRGLSAQQQRQFPQAAPAAVPPSQPAASAAPPRVQAGGAHEVFDRMGQGIGYATTFALPPVELRREFREFDMQLDARRDPRQGATRTRAASEAPVVPPAAPPMVVAGVADALLESDLDALDRIQCPPTEVIEPAAREPVIAPAPDAGSAAPSVAPTNES